MNINIKKNTLALTFQAQDIIYCYKANSLQRFNNGGEGIPCLTSPGMHALYKKVCISSFRNAYGAGLPCASELQLGLTSHYERAAKAVYFGEKKTVSAYNMLKTKHDMPLYVESRSARTSMYFLKSLLQNKQAVGPAVNTVLRCVEKQMLLQQGNWPGDVLGVCIIASGRLGKRKKGMAQQIRRSIGKVPYSTQGQKIDFCQDIHISKFGAVGLKLWLCYA